MVINLSAFAVVRFFATAVAASVAVPSGIVTPVFCIGAVIGRLFGEIISYMGGGSQIPGGYAVVGAAAFTAGVTGTVSIAVIIFELTSQVISFSESAIFFFSPCLAILHGPCITLCFDWSSRWILHFVKYV